MPKLYTLLGADGTFYKSAKKGKYAGWKVGKIFGKLDCKSGMRMLKKIKYFFSHGQMQ